MFTQLLSSESRFLFQELELIFFKGSQKFKAESQMNKDEQGGTLLVSFFCRPPGAKVIFTNCREPFCTSLVTLD